MKKFVGYQSMILIIIFLSTILTLFECKTRVNCDASNDLKLGTTEFTSEFQQWQIDDATEEMTFVGLEGQFRFQRQSVGNAQPRRLNEYLVCESLNIKPYRAYAYYEYDDKSSAFVNDSMEMIITVEPDISYEGEVKAESIFLSFNNGTFGLKGRLPVTNPSAIQPTEPFGQLFEYHESLAVGDETLEDIWMLQREASGIYYRKSVGIVALKMGENIWFRER